MSDQDHSYKEYFSKGSRLTINFALISAVIIFNILRMSYARTY